MVDEEKRWTKMVSSSRLRKWRVISIREIVCVVVVIVVVVVGESEKSFL